MKKLFKSILLVFTFFILSLSVNAKEAKFIDVITGTGKTFGDEVAIGDEHFYVLSYDGEEIRLLAKYGLDIDLECEPNLKSGKENTKNSYDPSPTCKIRPNPTGLQSSKVDGEYTGDGAIIGIPYITNKKYGEYPSAYKGSLAEEYVNKYVELLKKKYNVDVTGDLVNAIDMNRMEIYLPRSAALFTSNAPTIPENMRWFFSLNYWTRVAYDYDRVEVANKYGYFDSYDVMDVTAVRPVIVVSADNLKGESPKEICKDNICFTDNDGDGKVSMSDKICVNKECFYVLQNTGYEVKMLARYNLEIGSTCIPDYGYGNTNLQANSYGPSTICSVIAQASRIQDKNAKGFIGDYGFDAEIYGVTEFANEVVSGNMCSSYKGSLAKEYVDGYVEYLKKISKIEFKGSLLKIEDIEDAIDDELISYEMARSNFTTQKLEFPSLSIKRFEENKKSNYGFINLFEDEKVPTWLYSSSYWTRTSLDEYDLMAIISVGASAPMDCEVNDMFGIRPLITIPIEAIPTSEKVIDTSACYECDGELVWTDKPSKSCKKDELITSKGMCVNNPKTGIRKYVVISLIVALSMVLGYVLYRRYNRFGRI